MVVGLIAGVLVVFYILGSLVMSLVDSGDRLDDRWHKALVQILMRIVVGILAACWYAITK